MSEVREQLEDLKIKPILGRSRFLVETPLKKVLFIEGADPERDYYDTTYLHYKLSGSDPKADKAREVVIFVRGSGGVRHAQLIENAKFGGKLSAEMAGRLIPTGGGKISRNGESRPSSTYGVPEPEDEDLITEVFQKVGMIRAR